MENRPSWITAGCADLFPCPPEKETPKKKKRSKRIKTPSPKIEPPPERFIPRPLFFQNYKEPPLPESCESEMFLDYKPPLDCRYHGSMPPVDGRPRPLLPTPPPEPEPEPCPPKAPTPTALCPVNVKPTCLLEYLDPKDIPKRPVKLAKD